ncbi:DUF5675 family protein [Algoriphagus terrigena]|uniref:DUF5675 family protein n=1 Tax=Algoriphagus terrigena TaxID=344884 RepID=UPI0004189246|nr:DUF5675 family protein [Algoriphagus terrigena]
MKFLLTREYWPGGTNGSLSYNGKILCATAELPSACFHPSMACLPEGVYELDLVQSSSEQQIAVFQNSGSHKSKIPRKAELGLTQLHRNIVLVSEITGEGRGVPGREVFQNLTSLIGQTLGKGEKATLEIRSCPECALNLTYHQIQWMD